VSRAPDASEAHESGKSNQTHRRWSRFARTLGSANVSYQANLTVPPSGNVSLCHEATVAHKLLNTASDHMMTRISLRQFRAKSVRCRHDDHRNLPPRRLGNRENGIINLSRTHTCCAEHVSSVSEVTAKRGSKKQFDGVAVISDTLPLNEAAFAARTVAFSTHG
jgi:hypothetical protein